MSVTLGSIEKLSEADFQTMVLDLAKIWGWRAAHFRPGKSSKDVWMTAVAGDGKGFPDLILVRGNVILVAELKVGKNVCTPEQVLWLEAFSKAIPGVFLWYPSDWAGIELILEHGRVP